MAIHISRISRHTALGNIDEHTQSRIAACMEGNLHIKPSRYESKVKFSRISSGTCHEIDFDCIICRAENTCACILTPYYTKRSNCEVQSIFRATSHIRFSCSGDKAFFSALFVCNCLKILDLLKFK